MAFCLAPPVTEGNSHFIILPAEGRGIWSCRRRRRWCWQWGLVLKSAPHTGDCDRKYEHVGVRGKREEGDLFTVLHISGYLDLFTCFFFFFLRLLLLLLLFGKRFAHFLTNAHGHLFLIYHRRKCHPIKYSPSLPFTLLQSVASEPTCCTQKWIKTTFPLTGRFNIYNICCPLLGGARDLLNSCSYIESWKFHLLANWILLIISEPCCLSSSSPRVPQMFLGSKQVATLVVLPSWCSEIQITFQLMNPEAANVARGRKWGRIQITVK